MMKISLPSNFILETLIVDCDIMVEKITYIGPWNHEQKAVTDSEKAFFPVKAYHYYPDNDNIFYETCSGIEGFSRQFLRSSRYIRGLELYNSNNPNELYFCNASELDLELLKAKFDYLGLSFSTLEQTIADEEIKAGPNSRINFGKLIFEEDGNVAAFNFYYSSQVKSYQELMHPTKTM